MRTDDGSIIYECLNGEPEAFGVLVDKYKEGIYAFVYHKLRDFQDAQDVTQEVFLQAYRGLRSLRRWESFGFWLYRIAYARSSQWLRTRSKRVDREFIEDQDSRVMDAGSLDSYRDSQLSQSLREALDSLPEIHREVLTLHYFGGMNSKEIARATGASPGAIRVRLSRARAQLREEMVDMMGTAFEDQRIPAGFTLRIVESVRHIKINPTPRVAGLSWGLSLAMGIIIAVMGLNPYISMTSDIAIPAGSPLLVEAKVLETGEIPVDILDVSQMSLIANKQGDNDGGKPQRIPMFAPQQDEGGKWTQKADMPTARNFACTAVVDGKIYAIGGWNPEIMNSGFEGVEEYDPVADEWTRKADIPIGMLRHAIAAVDGKIYAIGGNNGKIFSTVFEYDPATDEWTKKADMRLPRNDLSASVVNGKIYAIGGNQPSLVEEYDPVKDIWTEKANMPTPRVRGASTAVVNGRIYAIGGNELNKVLDIVEEYDPATDTWIQKTDMPTARTYSAIAVVDKKIYVIGGASFPPWNGGEMPTVEIYDPSADTWTRGIDMPTARQSMFASAVDGRIYVIGGYAANRGCFSTVEEYDTGFVPKGESVEPEGKLPTKWGEIKSE